MNSKKAKRSKDQESLLISYNSNEDRGNRSSESDNNIPPLDLPPTRLRRPKSRKIHVAPQSKACCSMWNAVQVIFVLFTVGAMISMMWFTLILKTSLESMKKRVTSLESYDRSTTREYGQLSSDMEDKYKTLKANEEEAMKLNDGHYKSILRQIAHLNSTVNDLQKRVERPESANKITSDIESLKKGMADTGGEITEIKDKIKQLTELAGQQHGKLDKLTDKFFNLSVQVAQVMGKPTPEPIQKTGTPPLILRMPVSSDENPKSEDKVSFKNVTARISTEVARIMGIVTSVNHTLSHEVARLRVLMKSLLTEVKKHVATIDDLQTKVSQILKPNNSSVVSRGHLGEDHEGVLNHVLNLSIDVTKLSEDVQQHSRKLAELMLEVVQVNRSVYHHQHVDGIPEKSVTCNCKAEVGKLSEQLSSNKLNIESVKQQLQAIQRPGTTSLPKTTSAPENKEASTPVTKETAENQSLADSMSETDKDLEQEKVSSENAKPSPSPISNASESSVKVEEVTEPSKIASSTGPSLSKPESASSSNSTAPPRVVAANHTLPTDGKVEEEVIKLSTPSSEETIEESLENADSES